MNLLIILLGIILLGIISSVRPKEDRAFVDIPCFSESYVPSEERRRSAPPSRLSRPSPNLDLMKLEKEIQDAYSHHSNPRLVGHRILIQLCSTFHHYSATRGHLHICDTVAEANAPRTAVASLSSVGTWSF